MGLRLILIILLLAFPASAQFKTDGLLKTDGLFRIKNIGAQSTTYTVYSENSTNNLYLNSSELGASRNTTQNADIVFADDFEDHAWYECAGEDVGIGSVINTDGWFGGSYSGTTSGSCAHGPNVINAAVNDGAAGSTWAGTSGSMNGTGCTNGCDGNMATHELGPSTQTGYTELWIRWYWKFSPNFNLAGNGKFFSIRTYGDLSNAGFDIGAMGTGDGNKKMAMCPYEDCNVLYDQGYRNSQNTSATDSAYLWPNVSSFVFDAHGGNWIATEVHIKLETTAGTSQDGVWEMWADDCGPSGLSCPSSLTLRSRFTNVRFKAPGNNSAIRILWWEMHRDFQGASLTTGDYLYVDQIMVKKANGPIGPVQLPN